MKTLPRYTFGMGDRFGRQGKPQLQSVMDARTKGIGVAPVWNKSHREHTLTGTKPPSLRGEADVAVQELSYAGPYFVDADHINLHTVDGFLDCSDFFTLDVAEELGKPPLSADVTQRYLASILELGSLSVEGLAAPIVFSEESATKLVHNYGGAVAAAKVLFDKIAEAKDADSFAVEVSMDETETPQGPQELLGILRLLALEGVPVQTIAPKFTGRFNKGVDYVGDLEQFRKEFNDDLIVLRHAVESFDLPKTLKLSVHSGSDKFSLYPIIKELVAKHEAGLHLKTAGTTWLEEVIGLAEAGGDALAFVKQLYTDALEKMEALTAPYETVLDIDPTALPSAEQASDWTSEQLVAMVAHDQGNPQFNPSLRQFFHVAFKLAAEAGDLYLGLLDQHAEIVNRRVYDNLLRNHIEKIFPKS